LQDGILDRALRPPATPISFAAVAAPTMCVRLGAMNAILDSTYLSIFSRAAPSSKAMSHAWVMCASSAASRSWPWLLLADTVTTITVGPGRIDARSSLVTSMSLPIIATVLR
jgi:hypothetical protein